MSSSSSVGTLTPSTQIDTVSGVTSSTSVNNVGAPAHLLGVTSFTSIATLPANVTIKLNGLSSTTSVGTVTS